MQRGIQGQNDYALSGETIGRLISTSAFKNTKSFGFHRIPLSLYPSGGKPCTAALAADFATGLSGELVLFRRTQWTPAPLGAAATGSVLATRCFAM
jgi:hypothetical protein